MAGEHQKKLGPSELYDLSAVKRVLDDAVTGILEESGFREDTRMVDMKIALAVVAILVAVYAQFGLKDFHGQWKSVVGCVGLYCICMGLIAMIDTTYAQGSFVLLRPGARRNLRKDGAKIGMILASSCIPKYSSLYELKLKQGRNSSWISTQGNYEAWFTEDGLFLKDAFHKKVKPLADSLLAKSK
mmetsp:Transcript_11780/g.24003  ORF Transcript_11780/g.24003 Transcript_11780/m.24003 type:complete len:186 (+) Transcript_11780:3526-4083(+)